MGRPRRSPALRLLAVAVAIGLGTALPAIASAHPLGNFTINHYAEVRVEADRILLDVVIDHAEIPTFQARRDFDLDGDGSVSDEEVEAGRVTACDEVRGSIALTVDGAELDLGIIEAGLSFPLGAGGLSTMRQVCAYEARLGQPIGAEPVTITFTEGSFPERLGWREIVATGSGVTLRAVEGDLREATLSGRLLSYPEDRIATPLADDPLVVEATAGGPALAAFDVPDAEPVGAAAPSAAASAEPSATPSTPSPEPTATDRPAVVPGGIGGGEVPEIFREADLTPLVLLLSLITAAALGAGHALTPGHGKTLMAAYLVGTRGSPRHALGLGMSVSVSHTAGILALAAVVVAASDVLAPDVVVRWAPVVAAISIVAIGGWMLLGEIRRRREGSGEQEHEHRHAHGHGHDHDHGHSQDLDHSHDLDHAHGPDHAGDHSHAPGPGSTITWRSLFLLGLAGGLIPSTSALLILLGSIAAGRPAFGFILVVAFGLGMAGVMTGIGLALVAARDRFDRVQAGGGVARLRQAVPLVAAVVVLGFGVVLTAQALSGIVNV
jgi:nickel/cobalt transporter (NicO) family protein